ncbi:MAG: EpsI family protein [Candidatus Omnitrophica bacterium]|nr:EpsI family protein [Candidatus Omnitrophota bacterium]
MTKQVKIDLPYLSLILVLVVLALFPLAMPSSWSIDTFRDPLFQKFPMILNDWKGDDVVLDERTYEILETRNVLSRWYVNPEGERIDLLIVGSPSDRRVAHPPEVCYISSNYDVTRTEEASVSFQNKQIPIKEFIAEDKKNPDHREEVLYVYKVGDVFTTNYYAQQFLFIFNRLTARGGQVYLIRLSSPKRVLLPEFLNLILPYLA